MIQKIIENYPDESFLKADGFDDCIIGLDRNSMRLIYSVSQIIQKLIREGMTYEDAYEHFGYNIESAYVGDQTPIYCEDV